GTCTILGVLHVPLYESKSNKESWGDSEDEDDNDDEGDNDDDGNNDDDAEIDDHDDASDDKRTESDSDDIPYPNLTNLDQTEYEEEDVDEGVWTPSDDEFTDEEKLDAEETMDDEVLKELYEDVNVNLEKGDAEMTDANQRGPEQQNVSEESRFDKEEEDAQATPHATAIPEITSSFITTTPPLPLFFNPPLHQQTPAIPTPTFTTITPTYPIVTLPEISNFASVFKFDQRVSALGSELSKLKQTNQFAKVVSLIPSIVDMYLASKMTDKVNVVVQLQTKKLKEEAQAENQDFFNQDEDPFIGSDRGTKRRKSSKDAESFKYSRSKEKKSSRTSKDASKSQHKSSSKSVHREEPSHIVGKLGMQQDQEFIMRDNDEQP
nr:hypothetical protein [Tanacetum cinerariifolium]